MTAATDSTISMACSDVNENTYVLLLEWRCRGECSKKGEETLVKFTRGKGLTKQRDPRFTLNESQFELKVTGVRIEDAGDYFCLLNNKVEVDDKVRLTVLGNKMLVSKIFVVFSFLAPTEPPSRPLVTGFTSRSVDLSWTKPRPSASSPQKILSYVITIR